MGFELTGLPEHWETRPLAECVEDGAVTYGIVQPGSHSPAGIPMLRVNNFNRGSLDLREMLRISPEIEAKYARTRLKGGEVLLTLVGSVGQVAIAPTTLAGCNVARAVGVMRPLLAIGSKWLELCLRSPESQRILGMGANTTVQTTINLKDVKNLPIPLPPCNERAGIELAISALDDKITLLRETNATLEAIAQAIFKSWFVDFDPVRAKAEGREPEGVPPEVADLFPSEFENSELGAIPKGWKVGHFSEIAVLHKQARHPQEEPETEFEHYSLPAFDAGQSPVRESGATIKSNKFTVPKGAVLLSKLNPHIPRVWLTKVMNEPAAISSTEFLVLRPKRGASREWMYLLVRSELVQTALRQLVTGTSNSHQRVKPDNLLDLAISCPPAPIIASFTDQVAPLLERFLTNRDEADTLGNLRDTLLPRLMSGKLCIVDAHPESA